MPNARDFPRGAIALDRTDAGSRRHPCFCSPPPARSRPRSGSCDCADREDVAGMRRHGWELLADATRAGRDGAPAFAALARSRRDLPSGAARGVFAGSDDFESGRPVLLGSGRRCCRKCCSTRRSARHIAAEGPVSGAPPSTGSIAAFAPTRRSRLRQITAFPRDAMALKLVWTVVHARGLTPISVWDGEGGGAPSAWPRPIMVGADGGPARAISTMSRSRQISLRGLQAIDPSARPGDQLVLLAIHLSPARRSPTGSGRPTGGTTGPMPGPSRPTAPRR